MKIEKWYNFKKNQKVEVINFISNEKKLIQILINIRIKYINFLIFKSIWIISDVKQK